MQGRLRNETLSVDIKTECAWSKRAIHITVDSDLNTQVHSDGAQPLVFEPRVDFTPEKFRDPTILDAY